MAKKNKGNYGNFKMISIIVVCSLVALFLIVSAVKSCSKPKEKSMVTWDGKYKFIKGIPPDSVSTTVIVEPVKTNETKEGGY